MYSSMHIPESGVQVLVLVDEHEHKNTRCHEASSTVPDDDELVSSASPPLKRLAIRAYSAYVSTVYSLITGVFEEG